MTNPADPSGLYPTPIPRDTPLPGGLKVIAWSQVWGASVGTVAALRQIPDAATLNNSFTLFLLLAFLAFYTASGMGAILLLRGKRIGLRLLRFGLVPQLVHVQGGSFLYTLLSGFYALFYVQGGVAGVNVGIYSVFALRFGGGPFSAGFGLNVLALGLLIYLMRTDPFASAEREAYPARAEDRLRQTTDDAA